MKRLIAVLFLALFIFSERAETLNAQGGAGTIPETSIRDGSILARVAAAETITAQWTFTAATSASAGSVTITNSDPAIRLKATGGIADLNTFEIRQLSLAGAGNQYLQFRTIDDANAVFTTRMTIGNDGLVGINVTPTAQLHILSGSASRVGMIVDTAASANVQSQQWKYNSTAASVNMWTVATFTQLEFADRDYGNNLTGPQIYMGRNSNAAGAEGPSASSIRFGEADAGDAFVWADATGKLRIHTAAPTGSSGSPTVSDTAGRYFHDSGTDVIVADGGTGVGTFTSNGVVYGNSTGNLLVTAQSPANGVLAGNAGAPFFTATPTVTSLTTTADLTAGDQLIVSGVGPHVIGGATESISQLRMTGSFSGRRLLSVASTLSVEANVNGSGVIIQPTLVEAGTGTHPLFAGLYISAIGVTGGAAALTDTASLYIAGAASSGATGDDYAIFVDAGDSRLDGNVVIGGASVASQTIPLEILSPTDGNANGYVIRVTANSLTAIGTSGSAVSLAPTISEAASGTHTDLDVLAINPTIGNGSATVTNLNGIRVATFAAGAGTTNASGLRIDAPTAATNNYAIWADSGTVRIDGPLQSTIGANGGASALTALPVGYLEINIGGTGYIVPYYNK